MKYFDKTFWKFTLGFLVVILLGLGSLYGLTSERFLKWLGEYRIERANREIARIYAQDTFGGATPYETFDLFLEAAESGEAERASRYFTSEKQAEWRERLEEMKAKGTLATQVVEWQKTRETFEEVRDFYNDWENHATVRYKFYQPSNQKKIAPDGRGGFIEYEVLAGEHQSEIIFDFNKYSKVWKITLF